MNDKKLLEYINALGLTNEEFAQYLEISFDTLKTWLYRKKEVPKKKVEYVLNKIKLHHNYNSEHTIDQFVNEPKSEYESFDYKKLAEERLQTIDRLDKFIKRLEKDIELLEAENNSLKKENGGVLPVQNVSKI